MSVPPPPAAIAGVVLAGGRSSRMGGGDKFLLPVAGRPLLARVLDRLGPQVATVVLTVNGDPQRLPDLGVPLVADDGEPHRGPLAGMLAGLRWACSRHGIGWILTVPADTPFLPGDLASRLAAAVAAGATAACAASAGRRHPAVALLPVGLAASLEAFLAAGHRRAGDWLAAVGAVPVDFPVEPVDPFLNVNTPDELAAAGRLAERLGC
ncbi:MAG: molybdenum cofactor guanylyltransferase MobA [Geminicoccaceae bacterium]